MHSTAYFTKKVNETPHMGAPKKPSICLVITQGHWGGAQRYVFDVATSFAEEMDVTVAVGTPDGPRDLQERLTNTPIHVVQLTHLRRPISPVHDLLAIHELRNLAQQTRADIMHFNSAKAVAIGSMALAGTHVKTVATIHGWTSLEPLSTARRALYRLLERRSVHTLDRSIVPDHTSERIAREQYHAALDRLVVIPHGISTPDFLSRDAARAHLPGAPLRIIGTIANLYKTKNLPLLIKAFSQVAAIHHDICCVIIGEGTERQHLETLRAQSSYADRIFLTGALPDAATLLPAFDVFCLTSSKEGYPYVILEAMAAGIPIVSTAVGGVREMFSSYPYGTCVTDIQPPAIADAITHALTQPHTPTHSHPLPAMIDATRAVYRTLLQ